ncbi:MAG: hypothetical protein QNJ87_15560 [Gammaproteobacteria bacterium]|nr:hypothetical protein [Gammaproteobacteria bacterium]MDJ0892039.1 hypothetical protein [Gammaproteobacteria bacterium]
MSSIFGDYLRRLRELVPARTMAIYTTITGLYPLLSSASADLPEWVPFFVIGLCLALQVVLGIFNDNKKWYVILLSAIAFILYGLVQPYIGILGVFEASAELHFVFSVIMIGYVTVIPIFVTEFNN